MVKLPKLAFGVATLVAILALLVALPAAAAAAGSHHRHHAHRKANNLYWGAWIGPQLTGAQPPWDMSAASKFESLVGKRPSLIEFSEPWTTCNETCEATRFPTAEMESIRSFGSIPLYSWGSQVAGDSLAQPEYSMAAIASGAHDAYVREFAEAARNWNHPFFLRFDWEMNGGWFPWGARANGNSAASTVAAWRHVHDVFTEVGATDVTWVWCPYADGTKRFGDLASFYPGNRYVDWTCLDGYNWAANEVNPAPWRNFDQIFGASYETLAHRVAPKKPVMIGEVATNGTGPAKARWIRRMFHAIAQHYPRIRALAWFDQTDRDLNWSLESEPTLRAFSRGIHAHYFKAGHYSDLPAGLIRPPA